MTAWSDGYVLALGDQLARDFAAAANALVAVDPTLDLHALAQLVDRAIAHGAELEPGEPDKTVVPPAAGAAVGEMRPLIARVRAAGARAFDAPAQRDNHIVSTTAWPLVQMRVPPAGDAQLNDVELLNLGDLPPTHSQWLGRARIVECRSLRVLYFYGNGIDAGDLGMALDRLPALECLDLGDNRLRSVPGAVLRCAQLRSVKLAANPLSGLPDLSALHRLEYLDLSGTAVSASDVERAQRQLPKCQVVR